MTTFALGLSESIEPRLPEDPEMIYTVGFTYDGVKVGIDWRDREIVPNRVCRKASLADRPQCQQAALRWMQAECSWYGDKGRMSAKLEDMQNAVCNGADNLQSMLKARQVADL